MATDLKKLCLILYGVYALSALLQFSEASLIIGLIALMIAYGMTVKKREAAKGTPFESHLQWLSRTFWIGSVVIVPVAVIIATMLVLWLTDITSIVTAMSNGDPSAIMGDVQSYMDKNMTRVSLITSVTMAPTVFWWVRRCWTGFLLAKDGKPVENVRSWL